MVIMYTVPYESVVPSSVCCSADAGVRGKKIKYFKIKLDEINNDAVLKYFLFPSKNPCDLKFK